MKKYMTIYADPPWDIKLRGKYNNRKKQTQAMPYRTMSVDAIKSLNVDSIADNGCHLWLWTTNQTLPNGFEVMEAWGFKYLSPITWVKPQGLGNYFQNRTQTLLFGYKKRCVFPLGRYKPTVINANIGKHSEKPEVFHDYIETISPKPRIELFARSKRFGWDVYGDEVCSDIEIG